MNRFSIAVRTFSDDSIKGFEETSWIGIDDNNQPYITTKVNRYTSLDIVDIMEVFDLVKNMELNLYFINIVLNDKYTIRGRHGESL